MHKRRATFLAAGLIAAALVPGAASAQHGPTDGHLLGTGEFGKVELVGQVQMQDAADDLIADVAVDPDGDYAYLANWGAADCAGPETGGHMDPGRRGLCGRHLGPREPGRGWLHPDAPGHPTGRGDAGRQRYDRQLQR